MAEAELTVRIAGHDIPLGYTRRIMPNAVVAEWRSGGVAGASEGR